MHKTLSYILLITMALLIQCSSEKPATNIPEELMPDSLMVEILCDVYLVEGLMLQLSYQDRKRPEVGNYYYQYIYKKYGINKEIFIENMTYYTTDVKRLDALHDKVIAKLSRIESSFDSQP